MFQPKDQLVNKPLTHALALTALALVSLQTGSAAAQSFEQQVGALLEHSGGLTADQAAARARTLSYEAQARRADAAASSQRVVQAGLGYVPRVAARGTYTRVSDIGAQALGPLVLTQPTDNYSLQVEVVVPLSDYVLRLTRQYASARHSARAAGHLTQAAEAMASTDARLVYYAWSRARLQQLVAQAALELASDHLADAKSSLAAGQASQADVMQAEAKLADRELQVARARSGILISEERLRTLLHDPAGKSYVIGEPLLEPLPSLPGQHDYPALLDEALRRRPELRALRETGAGLRAEASQHASGLLPKLDVFGSAQYANPNPRYFPPADAWKGTWAAGAMVSWTSVDAIVAGTSSSASVSSATSADARANAVRDGIRDELLQAFRAVQDAELAIHATARSLSAAEEAYRIRRALFRAAQATSTELTETETALTQARFAAIDARIDLRMARARLDHATGRDVSAAR